MRMAESPMARLAVLSMMGKFAAAARIYRCAMLSKKADFNASAYVTFSEAKPLGRTMLERFLIIDDHPLFREALHDAIHLAFPVAETLEASSIDEAPGKSLKQKKKISTCCCWICPCRAHTALKVSLALRRQRPRLPVVIVSGLEDSRIVAEALACQALRVLFQIGSQTRVGICNS